MCQALCPAKALSNKHSGETQRISDTSSYKDWLLISMLTSQRWWKITWSAPFWAPCVPSTVLSLSHLSLTTILYSRGCYYAVVIPTLRWKNWGSEMSTNSFKISRLVRSTPGILFIFPPPLSPYPPALNLSSGPAELLLVSWRHQAFPFLCAFAKAVAPLLGSPSPTHHWRPAQSYCSQETLLNLKLLRLI